MNILPPRVTIFAPASCAQAGTLFTVNPIAGCTLRELINPRV